jgi:hypothetical protein
MEKDNVNIVNNSSLLPTETLDKTIHQEQEPEQPQQQPEQPLQQPQQVQQQPVHQIPLVNLPGILEEELEDIILPENAYSPLPQRIINPKPDNTIVEYKINRSYKDIAKIRDKTEGLDDEFDPELYF